MAAVGAVHDVCPVYVARAVGDQSATPRLAEEVEQLRCPGAPLSNKVPPCWRLPDMKVAQHLLDAEDIGDTEGRCGRPAFRRHCAPDQDGSINVNGLACDKDP